MDAGMVIDQPPKVLDVPSGYEALGRNIDIEALADSTFVADSSKPNASSIALVAEFEGRRALLTGDAHVDRLIQSLKPLAEAEGGRLRLDVAKLSHHGSKRNVSSELIRLLACPRYLVSTDGSHFNHPDPEAIARVIKHGGANVELAFNYSTAQTELWGGKRLRDKWGYRAMYPSEQGGYLRISC